MKALLISRPGDFGVLEDHWSTDPLFLPLPGGTVLDLHEASLLALGVTEARVLRCHPAGQRPPLAELEARLQGRSLAWSVRGWSTGAWPRGSTLSQTLQQQRVFLGNDEALVFFVPSADPRGWTGPKVPSSFPPVEVPSLRPLRLEANGRLTPWEGPCISLGGTKDFFRSSMRFLETLPPAPVKLHGIHRLATLEAPLSLGLKIHAASRSRLGPLVQLAAGSRLEHGCSLSRTLVLTATRFAADLSVADKIVVGDTVIEPSRGEAVALSGQLHEAGPKPRIATT